ncbi:MAG: DUF4214 domain-containing protein [Acidimicrobiia bacterium]|nr:DUF4214 domain-containing protein [Acidimicrobiia bacterium]
MVAIDQNGSLYVTEIGSHRVRKVTAPDTTDPTAIITSPADDVTVAIEDPLIVEFTCSDTGGSGLVSCHGAIDGEPITSGTAVDTTSATTKTLTVAAADGAGNTEVAARTITIAAPVPPYVRTLTGPYANLTGVEASLARLYLATFTRQPDPVGFAYWVSKIESGLGLDLILEVFVTSPEFAATYPDATDAEFVDRLYWNTLCRAGDTAGTTYWTELLGSELSRAELLWLFSESSEFRTNTSA